MEYIEDLLANRQPSELLTMVVPQFVPKHWWENLLHNQTRYATLCPAVQTRDRDRRSAVPDIRATGAV